MGTRPIFALLGLMVAAAATADVYRWVDEDGVVHFSDTPVDGAEQVDIAEANRQTGARVFTPDSQAQGEQGQPEPEEQQPFQYESFTIASPKAEETLWNIEGVLNVSLALSPPLQSGHRIRVYLDGNPQMVNGMRFSINEVWRGVHNIQAEVLDQTGQMMIRTAPTRFYVQQNTVRGIGAP
jgi:hypothetical protein